jgi:NADH-quinone oxidoreductase subunit M
MLLSTIVFLPLVGAILVMLAGGRGDRPEREGTVRATALAVSLVAFAATLLLWWRFDSASADFQFVENRVWLPQFGISYHLGVDGISLFLIVLTGFLTPLGLLCSYQSVHKSVKLFSAFLLALESAMLGVFVSIDLFLFYIFWDAVLIPMYFLIGIWGYERRIYAAVKFILYTMVGSILMLIAIIGLSYAQAAATGTQSFSLLDLYGTTLSWQMEKWFFLAFALAFLIKVPLFPFHTWLPDAHVEAPTAGSVILAGVMLKMGTYGLLRFAFPLFPNAAHYFAPYIGLLAVVGIIYGALVAMVQPDLKKLVAYSSVSHLGFVVLGLCAMNVNGVQGAVYQMLNHGVSTGGLFMTNGFIGEFLILLGSYRMFPLLTVFAATGVILSAVYMLWMFQRVNYGDVTNEKNRNLPDLSPREWALMIPTVALCILMGVAPGLFLKPMEPSIRRLLERINGVQVSQLAPPPSHLRQGYGGQAPLEVQR